jgi:hypothetical protein
MAYSPEELAAALKSQEKRAGLSEREKEILLEYAAIASRVLDSDEKRLERLEDRVEEAEKELALAQELAGMGEKLEGHYEAIYNVEQERLKLREEELAQSKTKAGYDEEEYKRGLKQLKLDQDSLKARKDAAGYTENLIGRMTGISDKPTSGIAKMFSNPEGFSKGFSDGIGKMITPMNIMTSTIDKVVETTMALAVEQDAAISGFRKATGATGAFDDDIVALEKDLRAAGVSSAEAAEAVQGLYLNVSGFSEMGSEARAEMEGMVATLAEVGVAAADSTKNIQLAIKGLSMSKAEATMLQSELRSFAQGINVSVGQLAQDFNTMGPQIAAMGDKGVDAFKSLQVTMKETGLEMSTMLGLVGQFDKFDTAGQSVGKLNALLGGPFLNTLELVSETDLGARMEKLRDGVMAAGVSFDELSYYQKKAYTSALGLNSEMELAMFLGNNMDSIIPDEKTAEEYEEIAKQTAEFNTVMDELRQAGMSLAVSMRPVVTIFKGFLQIIERFGPLITTFIASLYTLRGVLHLVTFAKAALTAATNAGKTATIGSIAFDKIKLALMSAKAGLYTWMTGAKAAKTAATVTETAAEAALSTQHVLTAGSLGTYVAAVPPAVIANKTLAGSSVAAGSAMAGAVLPMLAFGGAILMVGLGIGIAAAGMALFVNSIAGLAGLHGDIFKTALAILAVAAALDDIPLTKTVAVAAVIMPLAAMAPVAMLAAAAGGAIMGGAGGATTSAAAGGVASGPPPVINVHLSVDGTEFATAVNKVEIEKYVAGSKSDMHASIVDMLKEGFLSSS